VNIGTHNDLTFSRKPPIRLIIMLVSLTTCYCKVFRRIAADKMRLPVAALMALSFGVARAAFSRCGIGLSLYP